MRGRIAGDYGGQHPPCRRGIFFHKRMKIRVETRLFKPLQQMNKTFFVEKHLTTIPGFLWIEFALQRFLGFVISNSPYNDSWVSLDQKIPGFRWMKFALQRFLGFVGSNSPYNDSWFSGEMVFTETSPSLYAKSLCSGRSFPITRNR